MNNKETLLKWLAEGDLERCLKGLVLLKSKDETAAISVEETEITLLLSRFNTLKNNQLEGTVSTADAQLELARIRQSVSHVLQQVPPDLSLEGLDGIAPSPRAVPPTGDKSNAVKKWLAYAAAGIAVLAGMAEFSGWNLKSLFFEPPPPPLDNPVRVPAKKDTIVLEVPAKAPPTKTKNNVTIQVKDKAKVGNIITGDSNKIDIKQDF